MSSVLSEAAVSSADWLRREEEQLFGRYAVAAQRFPRSFRFRVPLVLAVYLLVALVGQALNGPGGDATVFGGAGNTLFSTHWADTFASPVLQSGPIFVLLEGIGTRLSSAVGLPYWSGGGMVTALAVAVLMVVACRAVFAVYGLAGRTAAAREFGMCMVFALTGGLWIAAMYAHPDDLMVGLLLLIAASRAAAGRHGRAGAFFGLAAGVKLWALIAIAVLLVRASRRASVQAGLMAAATVALCYGPFIVFGRFETFRGSWQIEHDAPLNLIFHAGTDFSWELRLFQAALATTVGLVVLLRTRGRNCAVWLVP
ncbi:MAG TPA: glycosyltransferase family 87 protein, partial [Acidothermaceae bacterium]